MQSWQFKVQKMGILEIKGDCVKKEKIKYIFQKVLKIIFRQVKTI